MAKKKRKMTPAQAAAARRDDRPKRERPQVVDDRGPVDRSRVLVFGVTVAMIALVVILSTVFAINPFDPGA